MEETTGDMARAKRPRTQSETAKRGPVHMRKAGVFAVGLVPALLTTRPTAKKRPSKFKLRKSRKIAAQA